jgi:hypothetical protein
MKPVPLSILLVCTLLVFSCGSDTITRYFYKNFFIHETSFTIEGEVFVNDSLTEKAEFDRIFVRTNAVEDWEIEGIKKEGNKFELPVDVTANGITLSSETITPGVGWFAGASGVYGVSRLPEDFPRCILIFYVDVRSARGAIEPEFGTYYDYVYIPQAIDISGREKTEYSKIFGGLEISEYYYDLNFPQPGWYKIYQSINNPIGNKAAYSSGANTKLRSPK